MRDRQAILDKRQKLHKNSAYKFQVGSLVFKTNEQKPKVSNPKLLPPYTDLYMVVGNKGSQAGNSQNFRLYVQNLRTNKTLAVVPPMLKRVTVSDLTRADFDIFRLLNIDYKRINTMYGGPQDSLQLLGMEQPVEAEGAVSVGARDTTPPTEDRVCQ